MTNFDCSWVPIRQLSIQQCSVQKHTFEYRIIGRYTLKMWIDLKEMMLSKPLNFIAMVLLTVQIEITGWQLFFNCQSLYSCRKKQKP